MATLCDNASVNVTGVDRGVNDLTTLFTMRYKLASDPDSAYIVVTDTKVQLGITYPYFDPYSVVSGDYILHTYLTSDGTGTGTKVAFTLDCGALT